MQNDKPLYEWSVTERQRGLRNFIAGNYEGHDDMGAIGLVILVLFLILISQLFSGESLWLVISGVVKYILLFILMLGTLRLPAERSMAAYKKENTEIAETYKVFDSGVEISGQNGAVSYLRWADIKSVKLYSHLSWSRLQELFGCHSDAIMLTCGYKLHDMVVDDISQKEEIMDYIKNKISLNTHSS